MNLTDMKVSKIKCQTFNIRVIIIWRKLSRSGDVSSSKRSKIKNHLSINIKITFSLLLYRMPKTTLVKFFQTHPCVKIHVLLYLNLPERTTPKKVSFIVQKRSQFKITIIAFRNSQSTIPNNCFGTSIESSKLWLLRIPGNIQVSGN